MERYLYKHPDGTFSIGKGKFILTNFSQKQLDQIRSEIDCELLEQSAEEIFIHYKKGSVK